MMDGSQITADNIDDWAQNDIGKILIAQQIINDMIESLQISNSQDMTNIQEILNHHLNSLKY